MDVRIGWSIETHGARTSPKTGYPRFCLDGTCGGDASSHEAKLGQGELLGLFTKVRDWFQYAHDKGNRSIAQKPTFQLR